ncbi:hypothetical protein HGRIS_010519 [Hohenbuehelia grisea]|uniref:Prephenate/arogenate dehydrogenase domain-containing protein n=1 Tax=Hohenbuehelia grisea TaxID=104357 RepID=A0ABR3IWY9_9AGAR
MALIDPKVSPDALVEQQPVIGIIGMGSMGRMYARRLAEAGWRKIYVCDQLEKYEALKEEFQDDTSLRVLPDGHAVSRAADFIMYSVEAAFIGRVVAQYGPSTKVGAIVAGQTSVKAPEKEAFETHLPPDTYIVSCHSLHGPTVSPVGQPLILIQHRAPDWALHLVESILRPFKSRYVYLSYDEHDLITANTQAVTHAAFLSMGTAWHSRRAYPWSAGQGHYTRGIETVKVNLTHRIYANLWHVYAGLAILNPHARLQIEQYARSATELFELMVVGGGGGDGQAEGERELRRRVRWAGEVVFGTEAFADESDDAPHDTDTSGEVDGNGIASRNASENCNGTANANATGHATGAPGPRKANPKARRRRPILLSEDILDQFSMAPRTPSPSSSTPQSSNSLSASPTTQQEQQLGKQKPNSHLSLLAMVDCWAHLGINPFHHLDLAATPLFRLFLGVAEHLFLSRPRHHNDLGRDNNAINTANGHANGSDKPNTSSDTNSRSVLAAALDSALHDTWHRADDLEFVVAARGWSQCVTFGDFDAFRRRFEGTRAFFEGRFKEASVLGERMIRAVMEDAGGERDESKEEDA